MEALFAAVMGDAGIASNVLGYLEPRAAVQLRAASKLCLQAVADHQWAFPPRGVTLPNPRGYRAALPPGSLLSDFTRFIRCVPNARCALELRATAGSPLDDEVLALLEHCSPHKLTLALDGEGLDLATHTGYAHLSRVRDLNFIRVRSAVAALPVFPATTRPFAGATRVFLPTAESSAKCTQSGSLT